MDRSNRSMNASLMKLFREALGIVLGDIPLAVFALRTVFAQRRAARARARWERAGLHVPPYLIVSVTNACNLRCKGCYAQAQHRPEGELSDEKLRDVLAQARDLGVSVVIVAGGEPLSRPAVLPLAKEFPGIIFPVFTNGLLLDDALIGRLERQKNTVCVLSLEGRREETDGRRGPGTYDHVLGVMEKLKARSVFWGVSLTITSRNLETLTDEGFVREFIGRGCRLFFFVEYIPVSEGTDDLVPDAAQRKRLAECAERLRSRFPGIFVAFPGDEEQYGGCMASGRGFVHVSAEGKVEPCPFAPYSDADLNELTLREALKSPLLAEIRRNHDKLEETSGGCALWKHREWVRSLTAGDRAERDAQDAAGM